MGVGPFHINLAEIGFTQDLQKELDKIPGRLLAITIPYILGIAFLGISFLLSIVEIFHTHDRLISWKVAIIIPAVVWLLIGNIITTYSAKSLVEKINDIGEHIGLSASSGQKFFIFTWIAFALVMVTAVHWIYELYQNRKDRKLYYY